VECEKVNQVLADFLTGDLEEGARREVQAHIASCPGCGDELRTVCELWDKLGVLPQEQPSPALRSRFYAMLEAEQARQQAAGPGLFDRIRSIFVSLISHRPAYRFATAAALLLIGVLSGYLLSGLRRGERNETEQLQNQVEQMRQMMVISLLNQTSASERLRGASLSAQVESPGSGMLGRLLQTLDEDPNVGVRLAAVDSLYLFSDDTRVREHLTRSLLKQESPLVQIEMIGLLTSIRERRALESLQKLLLEKKLRPEVRKVAEQGVKELSL